MKNIKIALALFAFAAAALSGSAHAAYSKKVRDACNSDYQNYCSQYVPESTQARRCFESNRKVLTKGCIRALIDAGEVPARYLKN